MSGCRLFFMQLILWFILSGYFEPFFIVAGVLSALLSVLVSRKLVEVTQNGRYEFCMSNKNVFILLAELLRYAAWVLVQAGISGWYVAKKVWKPKLDIGRSEVVLVATQQQDEFGAFLLANSITLTPGTVGMSVTEDYEVNVLLLDKSLLSGVNDIDSRVKTLLASRENG